MPTTKITQTEVLATICPPHLKRVTLFDSALTGFTCVISRMGHRSYALRYQNERGEQKQLRIGDASVLTADKARKIALRMKAKVLTGEDIQETRKIKRQVPTLADIVPRYLEHVRGYKRAPDIDERYLRLHLLPRFGKLRLDEFKQAEIVDWLNGKVRDGYAQATVNRWQVILSHIFRLAGDWDIPGAERNPLKGAKLKDPNNMVERFLSTEEIARLKVAVERSENPMLAPAVALLLLTGCRKREILDLQWDQVDLERRTLRIEKNKSGKTRHVPLSDDAVAVLTSLPQVCPYVLPNLKTMKPHGSIFNAWNTARKRAGLQGVRIHDLRHTLASQLAGAGHSLWVIANVLGHSQTRTTERYAHLSGETLRNAVNSAARVSGTTWASTTE